jgi:hypothetical protein
MHITHPTDQINVSVEIDNYIVRCNTFQIPLFKQMLYRLGP